MPISAASNSLELPSAQGMVGPDLMRMTSGPDFANCLSPGATPKVNIPPSAANGPIPHWPQSSEVMPQMLYAPMNNAYGCPPLMMVPFPCMMDESGQLVQFPYPPDQRQVSWVNGFHMMQPCPPESNISPEKFDVDTPCKDNSENAEEPTVDMPTSDCTVLPDDVIALGNPRQMLQNAGLAASVEDLLESSSTAKRAAIITWMQPAVLELALSANGTRVIQKAIQVTGGVARHQFGCRVVERMLEHCPAQLTLPIVEAVAAEIDSLSRHPFANYVIQHILEYVPAHRHHVVHALIQAGVPLLAQHRVASNIVERAFEHCDAENRRALAEAILSTPPSIVEMGCSRYGSFTVRRMLEKLQDPLRHMAVQQLSVAIPDLRASKHGRHIAGRVSAALSNLDGAHS